MHMSEKSQKRNVALCIVLLLGIIVPQIYWLAIGYENVGSLQTATWSFYVAAIFAFANAQRGSCFVFDSILWILRNLHFPRSELFAYLYSAAFAILGLVELHDWLHANA
jgi:hypothetical protein